MIIALDGPAASGKGTLARRLAAHFGLRHLDTGLLYRAVGHAMQENGLDLTDEARATEVANALDLDALDETALRTEGVGEAASIVAAHQGVRAALLEAQRAFARRAPGAVLDGRDIGTTVCPDADAKLFVTASPEVRAARRHAEMQAKGVESSYEDMLADIRRRDERDSARAASPLKPAENALLLDTSNLDIEAAFQAAVKSISKATGRDRKSGVEARHHP